jgi:hypothetical protein
LRLISSWSTAHSEITATHPEDVLLALKDVILSAARNLGDRRIFPDSQDISEEEQYIKER